MKKITVLLLSFKSFFFNWLFLDIAFCFLKFYWRICSFEICIVFIQKEMKIVIDYNLHCRNANKTYTCTTNLW